MRGAAPGVQGAGAQTWGRPLRIITPHARAAAELKEDVKGHAEFAAYLTRLEQQRADLQARVDTNRAWVENFEAQKDNGAFEAQYRRLLEDIQAIYEGAKEFHSKVRDGHGRRVRVTVPCTALCRGCRTAAVHAAPASEQSCAPARDPHHVPTQGLQMLIDDFGYHIAYKRWNDTFTAVPFKPK